MIYFLYESILFLSFGQGIEKAGTVMNTCISKKFYTNLLKSRNKSADSHREAYVSNGS